MKLRSAEERDTLDRAARAADRAVDEIQDVQELLARGEVVQAVAAASAANEDAQAAYLLLLQAGAQAPDGASARPAPVPLRLLDTPATRRLLDALRFAEECAREVDRERGWVTEGGEGCGWTDSVGDVCERVRQEVEGPAEGGQG